MGGIAAGIVAIGTFVGAGTGIVAGIVGGAIVGAAIGGLTAAITGGNILEGVLFGAVGGAVTGGIASWASGASAMSGALPAGNTLATTGGSAVSQSFNAVSGIGAGAVDVGASTVGNSLTAVGAEMGKKGLTEIGSEFVKDAIGGYMANEAAEDTLEYNESQAALNRQHDKDMAKLNASLRPASGGGGGSSHPGFDPARMAELEQRKVEFAESTRQYKEGREDVRDAKKGRGGALAGAGNAVDTYLDSDAGAATDAPQGTEEDYLAMQVAGDKVSNAEKETVAAYAASQGRPAAPQGL